MAWSVPCPECATQNEPDGSGAVLCSRCGRFYKVPPAGGGPPPRVTETTVPGAAPAAVMRAATYAGMGEIEAHLAELGITFQRASETSIQVVRQVGPQTVAVTIDSARTIHIVSASGVKELTLGSSARTRLYFDPEWKERYDFDLALEDKTFALLNAADSGQAETELEDPGPPAPAPPAPPPPVTQLRAAGPQEIPDDLPTPPLRYPTPAHPLPAVVSLSPLSPVGKGSDYAAVTTPGLPSVMVAEDVTATQRVGASSMSEALRSVRDPDEPTEQQSLAEISAMIPKRPEPPRVDVPTVITDLAEQTTQNEPFPRAQRARADDGPLPIPAVILPSTPDGKPPVLAPSVGPPPPGRATPAPPPMGSEPTRPSGRIHIGNGIARDVIDGPLTAQAEELDELVPSRGSDAPEEEGTQPEMAPVSDADTRPSIAAFRPSGERRALHHAETAVTRPPPPVLRRTDELPAVDETQRQPTAPRAMAARARRSSAIWAGLLGLAVGAAAGLQGSVPAPVASLFPPTAASEVRAGAQLARQGDVDGALAHFRRATELDPGSAPAWRNLGVAYAHKGDQVRSLQAYRTYLKLESDGEQARAVRALLGEK